MPRLRADEEERAQILREPAVRAILLEVEALLHQLFAYVDRRLQLAVGFAAIADRRRVERVQRVIDGVVVVQHLFLVWRQVLALAVPTRLGVPSSSLDRAPASQVMQAEMPRAGATH